MQRALATALAVALLITSSPAEARKRRKRVRTRPIPTFRADGSPNIQSVSAVAFDRSTGEVLYARNPGQSRPIASLSKLAATLAIIEHGLRLEETTTISTEDQNVAHGGARSRLLVDYSFTNDDLLHAALLGSDNRAVSALGRSVGLDAFALASAMTEKARALGLTHTRFADPVGLDYRNVSTARETIVLLEAVLANPLLARILQTQTHVVVALAPRPKRIVYRNTNQLLFRATTASVIGGKTGFNAQAGHCFVGAVRMDSGREVAAAFLGSNGRLTRFGDFGRLLAWIDRQDSKLSLNR